MYPSEICESPRKHFVILNLLQIPNYVSADISTKPILLLPFNLTALSSHKWLIARWRKQALLDFNCYWSWSLAMQYLEVLVIWCVKSSSIETENDWYVVANPKVKSPVINSGNRSTLWLIWQHKSGSTLRDIGLLPDCTKPLRKRISFYHQWGSVALTWGQIHRTC